MVEKIRILDHCIQNLWNQIVDPIKVEWDNYSPHLATWEDAYVMHQQFPYLFDRLDI
jgi:hypothetical protein